MDGYKQNSLKAAFGLEPITPNEQFYRNPCAETISDIPKSFQTEEMVLLALNGETTQKLRDCLLSKYAKKLYLVLLQTSFTFQTPTKRRECVWM